MIKKLNIFVATIMFMFFTSANAEIQYGIGIITGQTDISGSETEGTAADTSTRTKSIKEIFVGGDIFVEKVEDNGLTYGVSLVPLDIEIGSGSRTDTSTGADIASEADTGTRTASADLSNLITAYVNIPLHSSGVYALLGGHFTTVSTNESLNESSYPDEDIFGTQIGLGLREGKFKVELSYSDFEDISIASTGGGTNSISADADAMTLRLSYGF